MSTLQKLDSQPGASPAGMRKLSYLKALQEAHAEEMRRDPHVFLMGEDLSADFFGLSGGLLEEFGEERVRDTPISEATLTGVAAGAAMTGMRPIFDFTCAAFMYLGFDQLINMVAKSRYLYGGQASIPVVYRAVMLYQSGLAAQHSDRPYSLLMNTPGLKIVVPSNAYDAKGLMKAAVRDEDPVVYFEDSQLWTSREVVPSEDYLVPIGQGIVKREGHDVTLVGIGATVRMALQAADLLAKEGISAEVIDPRTLVPLDIELILRSVSKTGSLVVADVGHPTCSAASEIAALVADEAFEYLKGPIVRVNTANTHVPYYAEIEKQIYPSAAKIVKAVWRALRLDRTDSGSDE